MTSTPSHTPPPWRARPAPHAEGDGTAAGWILDGPPQPLGEGQFAKQSDAQIASAAPELCSSAESLSTLLETLAPDPSDPEVQRALSQAHAAIHKARGNPNASGSQAPLI